MEKLRIIVLGYIVRGPLGGLVWHHLQYVMGLRALGHDVWYGEESDDYPSCYDPLTDVMTVDPGYGLHFAARAFTMAGLADRWGYFDAHRQQWHGPCGERLPALAKDADLLLNLSGVNPLRSWVSGIPVRAFVDTDPVFTQVRHHTDPKARALALEHNVFFSFGENFGQPGCTIPDDGFPWHPTRQPVVLDAWRLKPAPPTGKLTTVMQWESYARREFQGRVYGLKADSFPDYMDLPARTRERFFLALGGRNAPRALLTSKGWELVDPRIPTRLPETYQQFIANSRAEFSIAKHAYASTRSGWFSERSACYLAAGRPVITQDTGYSDVLPIGQGLFAFSTPDQALCAIDALHADYHRHCLVARVIAEEFFDSKKVLSSFLARCAPVVQEVARKEDLPVPSQKPELLRKEPADDLVLQTEQIVGGQGQ